ncbi:MAG TPA: hypothetical protein PLN61_06580 [bacterium]|nr:hypothetical protein [bacterium]HQI48316.1 hypothetical protein [bacterium]HQJ64159.1 hypothetical protein [bacterium]
MSALLKETPHGNVQPDPAGAEKPLLFKRWRSWYLLELLALAAVILLLAWVTRTFR